MSGNKNFFTKEEIATAASHILIIIFLLLIMLKGLLPGLLCACLGFYLTRWLSPKISELFKSIFKNKDKEFSRQYPKLAAAIVATLPIILIAIILPKTRGLILDAPTHYKELLGFMSEIMLEFKEKLPHDIANHLPEGAQEIQKISASYLTSKAGALATTGRAWLAGLLFAFVGFLIGTLAAARPSVSALRPLSSALTMRTSRFGESFRQIIVAQFWIALFNTFLTAIFLLLIVPFWIGQKLPYTTSLILLTFSAGLIPIVGNLLCNAVLTLVGLSVSPIVALACLIFLIIIHKAEYFINAKVIGHRTHMGVWELLTVMFIMEAIFGAAGLVAAPLFYAYAKKELQASGWV